MALVPEQWKFLLDLSRLIEFASTLDGVMLSGGDLYQDNEWHRKWSKVPGVSEANDTQYHTPHMKGGQHPRRLAIDLNLFVNGVYISGEHEVWGMLGAFWEILDDKNRHGGNFSNLDYNHFERHV
jgi:hypothetical protein